MNKNVQLQVGDVIVSKTFAYAHKELFHRKSPLIVGIDDPSYVVRRFMTDDETVNFVLEHHRLPTFEETITEEDLGVPDPSRGNAKFVVIEANMQGGGSGHSDGLHIVAKRLTEDGQWNPNGEEIMFYASSGFTEWVHPEEIRIVGSMRMRFV